MRKFLFAMMAAAVLGLVVPAMADDKKDDKKKAEEISGVLIDNNCGKDKNQEAAAKHPIACAKKEGCAASGYQLVHGEKHHKFDEKSNEVAKAYLAEHSEQDDTSVVVLGTVAEDGTLTVEKIWSAKEAKEAKEKKEGKKESK